MSFLRRFLANAYLLTAEVSAALNPSSCVPPSTVEIPLAKLCMPSALKPVFHWKATSTSDPSSAPE